MLLRAKTYYIVVYRLYISPPSNPDVKYQLQSSSMHRKQNFEKICGNFWVNVTWFFAFFCSVLDWIVLFLVWFERSLHCAHISGQRYPWPLKLMMSQAVEGVWICMGSYRQLRGKWVKEKYFLFAVNKYSLTWQVYLKIKALLPAMLMDIG